MHKLHDAVTKEIDDIVCHGITKSNLCILGELVDIRKDIEEMWHYRYSDGDIEVSGRGSSLKTSVDELIDDIRYLNDKMKTTDSSDIHTKFNKDIKEIMMYAEKIKRITEEVKLDTETMTKFKNLFKY